MDNIKATIIPLNTKLTFSQFILGDIDFTKPNNLDVIVKSYWNKRNKDCSGVTQKVVSGLVSPDDTTIHTIEINVKNKEKHFSIVLRYETVLIADGKIEDLENILKSSINPLVAERVDILSNAYIRGLGLTFRLNIKNGFENSQNDNK